MNSLKRLIWLAFLVVSILLALIVILGVYQYRLSSNYNQVISQNERALFHYMTIRETITETMISDDWHQVDQLIFDIEKLNGELSRLKENRLVAAELKLALVDKIDLSGLAIQLRKVRSTENDIELRKDLQQRLRNISDYLIQYDRIIAGQARERIVNFQMVVIGGLGLIVSLASISLILLYKNTVSPLIRLSELTHSKKLEPTEIVLNPPVVKEITDLVEAIKELPGDASGESSSGTEGKEVELLLGEAINETTNRLNGIINYAQLLYDSSESKKLSEQERAMLQKIIDSGVSIAGEWQKLK